MKPLLVQYWGNSPLWREQTKGWEKKYYFFHHGHRDCVTIWKIGKRDMWDNHPTCKRGDWLLVTADKIITYTDAEYKQLAEV